MELDGVVVHLLDVVSRDVTADQAHHGGSDVGVQPLAEVEDDVIGGEWLTVDDIASELKVSKSIVYRLIRNGELEAVNIVETNGRTPKKGHYRTRRSSLEKYLESRKVRSAPSCKPESPRMPRLPRFKNYLGL